MSDKTRQLLNRKIVKLSEIYGWEPNSYGQMLDGSYFVAWNRHPAFGYPAIARFEFKHLQGLHAYLNDKLGSYRLRLQQ